MNSRKEDRKGKLAEQRLECERQSALAEKANRERDEARAAFDRLRDAIESCRSARGSFSCAERHDCRCPKSCAISPSKRKGEWVCVCGAEELDAALADTAPQALADLRARIEASVWKEAAHLVLNAPCDVREVEILRCLYMDLMAKALPPGAPIPMLWKSNDGRAESARRVRASGHINGKKP